MKEQAPGLNVELIVSKDGIPVLQRELTSSELVVGDDLLLEDDIEVRLHWSKGWWVTARVGELRLDGELCPRDIPQSFGPDHRLSIGKYALTMQRFVRRGTSDRSLSAMPRQDALRVTVVGRSTHWFGAKERVVIGSSPKADVPVSEAALKHAELRFDGTQWWAEDIGGSSRLLVDGKPMGFGGARLGHGGTMQVAGVALKYERCVDERFEGLFGDSEAVQTLRQNLGEACEASCILLLAEPGLHLETIARAVHAASATYSQGKYGRINCGDLGTTLESELCGHVKGAFTGAGKGREGLLQLCRGGTVFLDSVQNFPPSAQARLLRILQERAYRKVGDHREIPFHSQIIAAAPPMAELERAIEQGIIRRDFLGRLASEYTVVVPPLRARENDGVTWARRRLAQRVAEAPRLTLEPDAEEAIRNADWPRNFHDLDHVLDRLCLENEQTVPRRVTAAELGLVERAEVGEAQRIEDALRACGGNRRAAARNLGLSPRTMDRRIVQFELQSVVEEARRFADIKSQARMQQVIRETKGDKEAAAKMLGLQPETLQAQAGEALLQEREKHQREALEKAWSEAGGNVSAAARRLGLPRKTTENRLRKYGLKI